MTLLKRLFRSRSLENPSVPLSDPAGLAALFGDDYGSTSSADVTVTIDGALGVPAIWGAVNFLSNTLATLPLHIFTTGDDPARVTGPLADLLRDSPCEGWASFAWRRYLWDQVFTGGRFVGFIERNGRGEVLNIWPLEPDRVTVERRGGIVRYLHRDGARTVVYGPSEVIDISFASKPDQIGHRSPIFTNRDSIGQMIAIERYAARFFRDGGVPPMVLQGPMSTPASVKHAADDLWAAFKRGFKGNRNVVTIPLGHELKALGFEPLKGQMIEARKFGVVQAGRIYSLPPVFIQDLERATFSNTEQQDLHLVKHTIAHWARQFEDELNLKLFGRTGRKMTVRLNLDGLLRGDFKTRMDGHATAIQHGISTPNEARKLENRGDLDGGNVLYIQGATVPMAGQTAPVPPPPPDSSQESETDDD